MAGMSHAGVVRVEHAVVAVGAAMVAALVPLWFISGEAQAAGSTSSQPITAADAAPEGEAASTSAKSSTQAVSPSSSDTSAGSQSSSDESTHSHPIPVAIAPRDRLAPRSLDKLSEASDPTAFSEGGAQVAGRANEPSPPLAAPPSDPSHTPSGWFTPVSKYYFSARFGVAGPWSSGHHTGLDFVTKQGTPIRAATDGVVVAADWAGAYGQLLQIRIGTKREIWMAHLDKFAVKKGETVKAGQVVGFVGMTGNTTGPHCHFEVRVKGDAVDPEPFFWPDGNSVTRIRR